MTVKELIELLKTVPQESQVKMVYDGPDAFTHLEIKAVENYQGYVILDSSEWEIEEGYLPLVKN